MSVPGPPWDSDVEALLWCQRAPLALAGLIAYRAGPVGPYDELFAAPLALGGRAPASVAFMAVDSPASVAGGRRNWALPKELAGFSTARDGVRVRGEGWGLTVRARARTRALPAWAAGACAQPWPDGTVRAFAVRLRGRARPAWVEVEHDAPSRAAPWLRPGRHPALLVTGRQHVGPPRP